MPIVDTCDYRDCVRRVKELRNELKALAVIAELKPDDVEALQLALASADDLLLVRLRQVELARALRDEASVKLQRAQLDAENKRAE